MKKLLITAAIAIASLGAAALENTIWDDRPAEGSWESSWYPLGNGRLGCMVDGGAAKLRVQFNVDSLWTGSKNITGPVTDQSADQNYRTMGAYQNFGELELDLGLAGEVAGYRRELDLSRAVYLDRFTLGGVEVKRRVFASAPDDVIVIAMKSAKPLALKAKLTDAHAKAGSAPAEGEKTVKIAGRLANGLAYSAEAEIVYGKDRTEATVYLRARTSEDRRTVESKNSSAKEMFARHVADYQKLYNRCVFDLGDGDRTLTTRERIKRVRGGASDPALVALQFNFGRYLLIGCSRPGTMAANLQGLWNNSNNPAWHADYHTNINIQMNYWGADSANLSECFLPYSDWMLRAMPIATEVTRASFPDSKGFAYQTSHNAIGGGGWRWNFAGAPWMAAQCYDHYLFTRDKKYLKETAWPLMKGAAEFMLSHELKKREDGTWVVKNGWSPEHGPREDGVTHDQQIVRELFRSILAAAKELKIDDAFVKEVAAIEPKLLKDKIGRWGQLQEWETDRDVQGDQHRHTSHLYAVYPGSTIDRTTPELLNAARVALDGRALTGDSRRSWTWPWRAALRARMGEPDKAGEMLESLLKYNTLDNMFATHPPFQIDGNLGMVGAVGEILLESDGGKKLPASWPHGSIKGLRTRQGKTVDFKW